MKVSQVKFDLYWAVGENLLLLIPKEMNNISKVQPLYSSLTLFDMGGGGMMAPPKCF